MREYVSQFREYLTEKKAVSENTLQSYMRDIQHFLTFMKEHQFTDLLKADDTRFEQICKLMFFHKR